MRTPITWVACLFLWVVGGGSARAVPLALNLAPSPSWLVETDRRVVDEGIAEYSYTVQVGVGVHDVIVVHRVVAELAPGLPLAPSKSIFLLHGDIWGFRGAFLPGVTSSVAPRAKSFALYLARRGLDVWGVDLRWVHVPAYTQDFSFMKNWNLEMYAQDVSTGLTLARTVRTLGARSLGAPPPDVSMPLLGWSRGATIGYALLNAETHLPPERRQVSAFVAVDMAYVLGADATGPRADACLAYKTLSQLQMEGTYEDHSGQFLQDLGAYANAFPSMPSTLLPGFTHRQAALMAGSATFMMQSQPIFKWYHFTGGTFASKLPQATLWTDEHFLFDTLELASPFQSLGEQVETMAMWCGAPKLPYNDRLRLVTVPALYVGAAGGTGRMGLATLLQLGSQDLSAYTVQRLGDADRARDYGHADLFLASDADTDAWPRIASWLERH